RNSLLAAIGKFSAPVFHPRAPRNAFPSFNPARRGQKMKQGGLKSSQDGRKRGRSLRLFDPPIISFHKMNFYVNACRLRTNAQLPSLFLSRPRLGTNVGNNNSQT